MKKHSPKKIQKHLSQSRAIQLLTVTIVIAAISVAGLVIQNASKAAGPFVSSEAETGTRTGSATISADATASGGSAVKFAQGVPPPPPPGGPFLPYIENSFFRKPLPAGAPLDSQSAAGINFLKTFPDQRNSAFPNYPIINGVSGNKWGTTYFEGTCSDPVWKLTGTVPAEVGFLKTEGFHAPASFGNVLTGTSDSPFTVMDICGVPTMPRGLSVWGAKAVKGVGNTVGVGAAGAFQHDSNGLDKRNPRSTSTKNFRSRGAIPDAMVIRKDRLDWAIANNTGLGYVLHMFMVETDTTQGFVHPMTGDESLKNGWGPEGIRIRIKPSINLATRGMSPAGLVVARTLQQHGAYVGDNAGTGTALKAEQDYGQWGGKLTQGSLQGVTWDDFEFVQRGYEP